MHLAWDVMVGIGTLLCLLSAWYWAVVDLPTTHAHEVGGSCASPPAAGIASVITMEAGWVVSEVGRQPWIVYNYMKVEAAATGNTGVWVTFIVVVAPLHRARLHHDPRAARHGSALPRGRRLRRQRRALRSERSLAGRRRSSDAVPPTRMTARSGPASREHRHRRGAVHRHDRLRRVRRGRLRGRDLGPAGRRMPSAGRGRVRSSTTRSDRSGRPNHVWLIFCFVVLWTGFSEAYASITLTLFVPLTLAAVGIVLRGSSFAFRKAVFRNRDRRNFGAAFALSSVLVPFCLGAVAGGIASGRVPAGGKAGDPWHSWLNPTSILGWRAGRGRGRLPGVGVPGVGRQPSGRRARWWTTSAAAPSPPRWWPAWSAFAGLFVLRADARFLYDGLTSRGLPLVILSAVCGVGALVLLVRDNHQFARLAAIGAVASIVVAWGVAQWDYMLPQTPDRLPGRVTVGDARDDPRRDRRRGAGHLPVHRPAVRARPARTAPR